MVVNKKKAEDIRNLVFSVNSKKGALEYAQDELVKALKGTYSGGESIRQLDETIVKLRREWKALKKKLAKKIERSEVSPSLAAIAGSKAELAKTRKSGHLFKSSRKDSHGYE